MLIQRNFGRTNTPRSRAKDSVNPLQKTAEGLGTFLNKLSETMLESQNSDSDSIDSGLANHSNPRARNFKFPSPNGEIPIDLNLNEEQTATLATLKEARNLAVDASHNIMPMMERMASQERLQTIMLEINAKEIEVFSPMLSGITESESLLFLLITPELAREAYSAIDDMIIKFLNAGAQTDVDTSYNENSPYIDHKAALNASEQLRDFLLHEGPVNAFARFREINRSNILGLLQ